MQKPIAQAFTRDGGDGIDIKFDSDEAELIFWHFISQLDKNTIIERIRQLEPTQGR